MKILPLVAAVNLATLAVAQDKTAAADGILSNNLSYAVPVWGSEPLATDYRVVSYILPKRIMWIQSTRNATIENQDVLLKNNYGQAVLSGVRLCHINNADNGTNSLLFDFGREIHGGVQIVTGISATKAARIRVRFGESAEEAMCEIDGKNGATNDHAIRDFIMELPWLGIAECGNSGFRFVRIDVLGSGTDILLQEVRAAFKRRDIPYLGAFKCSDSRLNDIWMTGAYTVHLNMQQYLWDGIKRDRLVWTGDINPEINTIAIVFGFNDVVNKSLDLSKEIYKPDEWMCGLSSYSMWWLISHYDWYMYTGDRKYLDMQQVYVEKLLNVLLSKIDSAGYETLDARFLDWPSSTNEKGIDSGMQALMEIALEKGVILSDIWGNNELSQKCSLIASKMKKCRRDFNGSKQAASLNAIAGMIDPAQAANETILKGGSEGFSTFYGYYMLEALALAGKYIEAIDIIDKYWGAMLDLGATTFWEDFNIEWAKNAARIDELTPKGKVNIHEAYGDYCYKGYRHSLCHGWASGPTAWLSRHVLGVKILEPGCRKLAIEPHLGNLKWANGRFPTPYGVVEIYHQADDDGKIVTKVKAPKGVKIVKNK